MPIERNDLIPWVLEALNELGGNGRPVDVCRVVWENHQDELMASGEMVYKWQYEIRWAKQQLRDSGTILAPNESPHGVWMLSAGSHN